MFMQKVSELFQKAVELVTVFYNRPDVQNAIGTSKQMAAEVVAWIRTQVKAQPEAAVAGGIVACVMITAISSITMGLVVSVVLTSALAIGAHYYFTKQGGAAEASLAAVVA